MLLEQDLAHQRKLVQDNQLEMDFQVKENIRVRELVTKLENDRRAGLKGVPVSHQQTQCDSPQSVEQATQTSIKVNTSQAQTTLDVEQMAADNQAMVTKIAELTQQSASSLTQSQLKRDLESFKLQFQAELQSKSE